MSRAPVLTRSQRAVARDGRLGSASVTTTKDFAPRFGWAWNPDAKSSFRAGAGIYVQYGDRRFDMARNLSRATTTPCC